MKLTGSCGFFFLLSVFNIFAFATVSYQSMFLTGSFFGFVKSAWHLEHNKPWGERLRSTQTLSSLHLLVTPQARLLTPFRVDAPLFVSLGYLIRRHLAVSWSWFKLRMYGLSATFFVLHIYILGSFFDVSNFLCSQSSQGSSCTWGPWGHNLHNLWWHEASSEQVASHIQRVSLCQSRKRLQGSIQYLSSLRWS